MERFEGTIKSFDATKRQGIIERKDSEDVVVHADAVVGGMKKNLKAGARVEYAVVEGPKGPRAATVRLL